MLHIIVPKTEWFNEETNEFFYTKETSLTLEHSLISLSKWESKWKKPFLGVKSGSTLSPEEFLSYVECMTVSPKEVDPYIYRAILYKTPDLLKKVQDYIDDPMTATWFSDKNEKKKSSDKTPITSEVIYYWMCKLQIPVEFERWHLNRLITLIEVFNANDAPKKKKNRNELLAERRALNEQRKRAYHTKG